MYRLIDATGARICLLSLFTSGSCCAAASAWGALYAGQPVALGGGTVNTYLVLNDDGMPRALGIRMTESALQGLPPEPSHDGRCFDRNQNGVMDANECLGDHEYVMSWPPEIENTKLPFKWMGLDWNPHGHNPPHVYDKPHFDMHFYMVDEEAVRAIRPGSCGELIDCADFERARKPLAPALVAPGYVDVGAAVAEMGNHLVNTASPELSSPPQDFTHTLIYGAYDGHITFVEPMITRDFLLGRPNLCVPIAQPASWEVAGDYPTQYCMRYLPGEGAVDVSLEGFVRRDAMTASGENDKSLAGAASE